jgi:transcriptional regulator with XRE-family HTH domain
MAKLKRYPTIKHWRLDARLNQREAATILRISQAAYWRLEAGIRPPRPRVGKAIADKTGVSFESIMGVL